MLSASLEPRGCGVETHRQWCDQSFWPDWGKIGAGNIKIYSHVEGRYYCTTCTPTFSADKGTFFATLRTERHVVIDAVAMLGERNSLRAISRIKHCKPHTLLHWLDLAGQHVAAVSTHFIRGLHVTQAQIDELWTFVKKTGAPATGRPQHDRRYLALEGDRLAQPFACGPSSLP
jgi:hypothetical protein